VRSRTAIDRLIARREIHLREKTLRRMLYETCARAEEILQVNIEYLDLAARSAPVKSKGAKPRTRRRGASHYEHVLETVYWDAGTARLLPRLIRGRTRGVDEPQIEVTGESERTMSIDQEPAASFEAAEQEPDYRFTLANERTYLAWIRTSLGFLACSVAVHQFLSPAEFPVLRTAIAAICTLLAIALRVGALLQWRRVQRAMRLGQPLPTGFMLLLVAGGMILLVTCTALVVMLA